MRPDIACQEIVKRLSNPPSFHLAQYHAGLQTNDCTLGITIRILEGERNSPIC
jgi:hypothetical protein